MHQLKSNWGSVLIYELSPAVGDAKILKTVSTSTGISKYWVVSHSVHLPIPIIVY